MADTFNPLQAAKSGPLDLTDFSDQQLFQHLSDPAKFREAIPDYAHLSDDDIRAGMQRTATRNPAYVAPSVPNPILKASQMDAAAMPSAILKAAQTGSDVLQGIGEGAFHTVSNIGRISDPITRRFASPAQMEQSDANIQRITTPSSPVQSVAKTGEQIGEFFLPTGLEEQAANVTAKVLPSIAKYMAPAAKVAAGAVDMGLKNKAQGGDFTTGVEAGAAGGAVGEGFAAVAPKLAEGAVGLTAKLRKPGSTIGKAILDETSGFSPSKVAASAQDVISGLNRQLETAAAQSTNVASTQPALQVILNETAKASEKNAGPTLDKLDALWNQLTKEYGTGQPIPTQLSPSRILQLKRGVGDVIDTWSPTEKKSFNPIKQRVYAALDAELDRTVPGAQELNQRMSNLIPANRRANVTARSADVTQRVLSRVARPTGALVGAGIGYHEGGTPGAMVGLIAPEILASPTARMAYARMAANGALMTKGAAAAGLQLNRPSAPTAKDLADRAWAAAQKVAPNTFKDQK